MLLETVRVVFLSQLLQRVLFLGYAQSSFAMLKSVSVQTLISL